MTRIRSTTTTRDAPIRDISDVLGSDRATHGGSQTLRTRPSRPTSSLVWNLPLWPHGSPSRGPRLAAPSLPRLRTRLRRGRLACSSPNLSTRESRRNPLCWIGRKLPAPDLRRQHEHELSQTRDGARNRKDIPPKRRHFQCHQGENSLYQSVLYSQGDLICARTRARGALRARAKS